MRFTLDPFALSAGYVEGVLPLAEVKAHLSIEPSETEFDTLLAVYAAAAVDQVERYCEVAMGPKTNLVWRAESIPARLVLPVRPIAAVTAVSYLDSNGETVAGVPGDLRITAGGEVVPVAGKSWPSNVGGGVALTFSAGFAAGACPPALKQAARMFAAHLFANREAVITGTISGEIPLGFRMLCSPFRAVAV